MSNRSLRRLVLSLMLGLTVFQAIACFGPFRRHDRREERRDDRYDHRDDRQDDRHERHDDRRDDRHERHD